MSREILFRAKNIYKLGKWYEGLIGYQPSDESYWIFDMDIGSGIEIDPSTVCQYTGLEDENGKKIFEGDILEGRWDDKHPEDVTRAVVEWILFGWYIHEIGKSLPDEMNESDIDIWTVCGNVWDNPELLEGGTGEDD